MDSAICRWRTMFWVATIPGGLLITGMQFCVESPRWLGKVSGGAYAHVCIASDSSYNGVMKQLLS